MLNMAGDGSRVREELRRSTDGRGDSADYVAAYGERSAYGGLFRPPHQPCAPFSPGHEEDGKIMVLVDSDAASWGDC